MQPITHDAKLRRLVRNMVYDGVLSRLLSIDMGQMEKALRKQMGKKQKAIELNMSALKAGSDYAEATFTKQDPFVIEPMNKTQGMILIEGNAAAAIGCMMAGVTVVAWYPITPSSSLPEALIDYLKKYRRDRGKRQDDLRGSAGRRRTCRPRNGDRCRLGGRAGHDLDGRSRRVIDGGVHRPRLLRGSAGSDLRHSARRSIDRVADAHRAAGHSVHRCSVTRRHEPPAAASVIGHRVLHDGDGSIRSRRGASAAGLRDVRFGPRHEHVDGAAIRVPTKPFKRGNGSMPSN